MRHQDMKVLGIDVTEKADAASVTKILYRIAETTGLPAQILSDGGSSIKRGVSDFIKEVKKADSNSEIRQTWRVKKSSDA
jgi:hypothetical protein